MQTASKKKTIVLGIVIGLTIFAAGRYSAPEKVKIKTEIVEVHDKTTNTDTDRDKHRETTVTETTKPDGTKTTVTTTTEDTKTDRKTTSAETDRKTTETVKEVTKSGRHLTFDVLAGLNITDLKFAPPVIGAHIGVNLLGPIRLGVFGLSSGVGGVSLGLAF